MSDLVHSIADFFGMASRPYGLGGIALIVLYVIEAEIRFGTRARSSRADASDRGSTVVLSLASMIPVIGFIVAMKLTPLESASPHPILFWLFGPTLPGLPNIAWAGFWVGIAGLALRLWAVLTLRHRYTRTLLVQTEHEIERRGPYAFVRHPGYLGSLLCLNAIAFMSGSLCILAASLVATIAAYLYRVRVEDRMLLAHFGPPYEIYRREVGGLMPSWRKS